MVYFEVGLVACSQLVDLAARVFEIDDEAAAGIVFNCVEML